jgi:hypothetical protein
MKSQYWLWLLLAACASAEEANIRLAPTPLEMPRPIGPLQHDPDPHKYDDPAPGVSYQYNARGASLTIYVYDAGTVRDAALGQRHSGLPACLAAGPRPGTLIRVVVANRAFIKEYGCK